MIIALSLLIAIIGLLIYALSKDGKVAEIGRVTYFAGLLSFLLQVAQMVTLGGSSAVHRR